MAEQYVIPATVQERALAVRHALARANESAGREAEHALEQIAHRYGDDAAVMVIQHLDPLEWGMIVRGRAGLVSFTAELLTPIQVVAMLRAQFLLLASIDSATSAGAIQEESAQILTTLLAFASSGNRAEIKRRDEVLLAIAHDTQAVLYVALPFIGSLINEDKEFADDTLSILARIIQSCDPLWREVSVYIDEFGLLIVDEDEESKDTTPVEVSLERVSKVNADRSADSERDRDFVVDGFGELQAAALQQGMTDNEELLSSSHSDRDNEELPRHKVTDTDLFKEFIALISDARRHIMAEKIKMSPSAKGTGTGGGGVDDMFKPLT